MRLTQRELFVLRGVAEGRTAEAIARRLELARETVVRDLHKVRTKLGAVSTPNAVHMAHLAGLLKPEATSAYLDARRARLTAEMARAQS